MSSIDALSPSLTPPPPERPELPDGAELTPTRPRWKPYTALLAFLLGLAGALVGGLLLATVAAIFGADLEDPPAAVNILATAIQGFCFIGAAIFFASRVAKVAPWQFGLRAAKPGPFVGWILAAYVGFIAFSAAWVGILGITEEDDLPSELGVDESTLALIAVAFLVCVIAPVAEEFLFRGYIFSAMRNWRGIWPAAVINGIVFGAIHAGSAPVGYLVPLGIFGVVLCLLYVRTKSLYPCIVLHAINNSIAFGSTQDYTWEILLVLTGSLGSIALLALAVRQVFGAAPARLSPV